MLHYFKLVGLALLLSVGVGSVGQAASFDCNKATTETEIAICADPELSVLDDVLGELWKQARRSNDVVSDQKTWLRKRDDSVLDLFDLAANLGIDAEWELVRYLRDFYSYRIVELLSGCRAELNLLELYDDHYPKDELEAVLEASSNLEDCIDDHYKRIAKDFEAISYSLSVLPEDCVIGFDPFMYPISERSGHYISSRCGINIVSRYVILLDSMLELIAEKNKGIPASLANDQIKWEAFYKGSCKFYDTPQFENSYTGNVGAQERCVFNILKFRILYLSSWIGIDSTFGWPAGSIAEVLGDEYGRYMQ